MSAVYMDLGYSWYVKTNSILQQFKISFNHVQTSYNKFRQVKTLWEIQS